MTIRPMPRMVRTTVMTRSSSSDRWYHAAMDIISLMKVSCPLEISVTSLSTYCINGCTENTFVNCIQVNSLLPHCVY
jgi:hypothetical protein